ncbi:MAG: prepilin-type N-terminal cleavage/methylation domain-containing protein [Deltaproteobacteria bacterium]|nr:MAG: prepilin-type N-terminal cleavage/methylation domain-containing protein [Deltaproteobacteria bacterium]
MERKRIVPGKGSEGFTLIELLVTLGLMGLLLGLTAGIFLRGLSFTRSTKHRMWAYEHARNTLLRLHRELRSFVPTETGAVLFEATSEAFPQEGKEEPTDRLKFSAILRDREGPSPFARRGEVEYFWVDRGFTRRELYRQIRYIDEAGVEEKDVKPVAPEIVGLDLHLLDSRGVWRDGWAESPPLPRQIKVTLRVDPGDGLPPVPFEMLINLP